MGLAVFRGFRQTSSHRHQCREDQGNPEPQGTHRVRRSVQIWFWTFIAKHILPVIGAERSTIFPLRITNFIAATDRQPAPLENGLTVAHKSILEPRNHIFSL